MSDKLVLESMLLILKSTVEVYVHGTLESSNNSVRKVLKSGLDDIMDMQFDTFNVMLDNGFYEISNIDSSTIEDTINNLTIE